MPAFRPFLDQDLLFVKNTKFFTLFLQPIISLPYKLFSTTLGKMPKTSNTKVQITSTAE